MMASVKVKGAVAGQCATFTTSGLRSKRAASGAETASPCLQGQKAQVVLRLAQGSRPFPTICFQHALSRKAKSKGCCVVFSSVWRKVFFWFWPVSGMPGFRACPVFRRARVPSFQACPVFRRGGFGVPGFQAWPCPVSSVVGFWRLGFQACPVFKCGWFWCPGSSVVGFQCAPFSYGFGVPHFTQAPCGSSVRVRSAPCTQEIGIPNRKKLEQV